MTQDFPLHPTVPGFPASSKLMVDATSDPEVTTALTNNTPFPNRDVLLGKLGVDFEGQTDLPVDTGVGQVTFQASANAQLGLGVYTRGDALLSAMNIEGASDLGVSWPSNPAKRFALLVANYQLQVSGDLTHPVGALASASFGVEGSQASKFALVETFDQSLGAKTALTQLVNGWKLPISIRTADDLPPGTSVFVEASGSLGLKLGATLGYDFSFVREVQAGGLSGDIGAKVATALATTIGVSAAGRFVICVERPSEGPSIRLRLFKLAKKGWDFALNLTVGAETVTPPLPDKFDEFVEVVFGVHASQVLPDLAKLEEWTDPSKSTGEIIAGLTNSAALELLKSSTGIDATTSFSDAKTRFLNGVASWQGLPGKVSSWLWQKISSKSLDSAASAKLMAAFQTIANPSDDSVKAFIGSVIKQTGFDRDIVGQFLDLAAGDQGVLTLLDQLPALRRIAGGAQALLSGDFLTNLQAKISTSLNLSQITIAVTSADWDKIDGWLVARLSTFFGEQLGFNRLDRIRSTINAVLEKRKSLYEAIQQAVTRSYEAKIASTYESSSTNTALIDATFDLSVSNAVDAYRTIVETGQWDNLFLGPVEGVTLGLGVLTHGLARNALTQLTLPSTTSEFDAITSSLAQLSVESEGAELVGSYSFNAANDVSASGRFKSHLSLTAALATSSAQGSSLRIHGAPTATWSYSYRFVHADAAVTDVRSLLEPIRQSYFAPLFANGQGSFDTWLADLDRAVEAKLHNGSNDFGNLMVSLELTLPGALFATWFKPRSASEQLTASCLASKAVQRTLRLLLLQSYTAALSNVTPQEATFALLVYAALPPTNAAKIDDDQLTLDQSAPYWNWPDASLVYQLARLPTACAHLQQIIEPLRARLEASGRPGDASFFTVDGVAHILSAVTSPTQTSDLLRGLLLTEAELIRGLSAGITQAAQFSATASTSPAKALNALADLGANLTTTFNQKLKSIYLPSSMRTIGSALFGEATRALAPQSDANGRALLALTVLSEKPAFKMRDFLDGKCPSAKEDIALEQRLVRGF